MQRNPGHKPREAAGKRVRGALRCGKRFGFTPVSTTAPPGWAADDARWALDGHDYDILEWEIAA